MINEIKAKIFTSRRILDRCRYIVHRDELLEFWEDMSLLEKEKLLCIGDQMVLEMLGNNIRGFITSRKYQGCYPAYYIKKGSSYQLSLYDCIVCRCIASDQVMRELVSSFLLIYKGTTGPITVKVHEVIDNDVITGNLVKVKASYILRLVNFFDHFFKETAFEGEKIVISSNLHNLFIVAWLSRLHIKRVEDYTR